MLIAPLLLFKCSLFQQWVGMPMQLTKWTFYWIRLNFGVSDSLIVNFPIYLMPYFGSVKDKVCSCSCTKCIWGNSSILQKVSLTPIGVFFCGVQNGIPPTPSLVERSIWVTMKCTMNNLWRPYHSWSVPYQTIASSFECFTNSMRPIDELCN